MLRVVIAPDSFKGSLSAPQVCAAIARGLTRVWPDVIFLARPMADGGEGTRDAVLAATGDNGQRSMHTVTGAGGSPIVTAYGIIRQPEGATRDHRDRADRRHQRARAQGVPATLISGSSDAKALPALGEHFAGCFALADGPMTLAECVSRAEELLADRSEQAARMWDAVLRSRTLRQLHMSPVREPSALDRGDGLR